MLFIFCGILQYRDILCVQVVVPDTVTGLPVCFGKNSDRPSEEEHQVIHSPRRRYAEGTNVKCTYIEVPQVRYSPTKTRARHLDQGPLKILGSP